MLQKIDPSKINMTPLWVISLFLSLTEVVAGFATNSTNGEPQLILVWFIVLFPVIIALGFFLIIWYRPHHLYSPTEYQGLDFPTFADAFRNDVPLLSGDKNHKVAQVEDKTVYLQIIPASILGLVLDVANSEFDIDIVLDRLLPRLSKSNQSVGMGTLALYSGLWIAYLTVGETAGIWSVERRNGGTILYLSLSDENLDLIAGFLAEAK